MLSFAIVGNRNWVEEALPGQTYSAAGEANYLAIFYVPSANGFIFSALYGDDSGEQSRFALVQPVLCNIGTLVWAYDAALLLKNASDDAINGA
jgi:hypothetical protein